MSEQIGSHCGSGCCGGANHDQETGCCGCSGGMPQENSPLELRISPPEEAFLSKLAQCPFLPVAEFFISSSKTDDFTNLALSPVFLETGEETLEEIKIIGQILLGLEEKNIISLDFDSPLEGSDPNLFYNSHAFALLKKTVEEGNVNEGFLFDTPTIELGSVCLTAIGDLVVEQLDFT